MNTKAKQSRFWMVTVRTASILVVLVSAAVLAERMLRFWIDVPYWDQWELVPLLEKMFGGTLTVGDLFAQQNEHRIFFPLLIMLGLARLTHWDIRYELVMIFLLACAIFAVIVFQFFKTRRRIDSVQPEWPVAMLGMLVFSFAQWENWMWGWQIQILFSVWAIVTGIYLLDRQQFSRWTFSGALVLGVLASFSFGNGLLYWIIAFPLVMFSRYRNQNERRIAIGIWFLLAVAVYILYFHDYVKPDDHPSLLVALHHPVEFIRYVLIFVGTAITHSFTKLCELMGVDNRMICSLFGFFGDASREILAIAGIAFLISATFVLIRWSRLNFRVFLPYLCMAVYVIFSGMVIGVGRVGFGRFQGGSSRYATIANLFWYAVIIIIYICFEAYRKSHVIQNTKKSDDEKAYVRRPWQVTVVFRAAVAFLVVIVMLYGLNAFKWWTKFQDTHNTRTIARMALVRIQDIQEQERLQDGPVIRGLRMQSQDVLHDTDKILAILYPRVDDLKERAQVLIRHRLSVFRKLDRSSGG